jgi:hypothetical protein
MLELLSKSTRDAANTAVSDVPAVQETQAAFDTAHAAYEQTRQRVAELDLLCAPVVSSSSNHANPPNRLKVQHAQAALPGVRLQLFEAEIALEQARAIHQLAAAKAKHALQQARIEPRRKMIAELFDVLHRAQQLANDIQGFDDRTVELGGTPPLAPVGELLHGSYRPSFVQFTQERLKQEGWL